MSSISPEIYGFGPFLLDVGARRLQRGDVPVALTPKVFDMLVILIRAGGTVVSKDVLMKELWPDSFVEEGNLTQSVFLLRKALGPDESYVETSPRRGYRFVPPVARVTREDPMAVVEATPAPAAAPAKGRPWGWLVAAAILLASGALLATIWKGRDRTSTISVTAVTTSRDVEAAAISPDGRFVAAAATEGQEGVLRLRQLATGTAVEVARAPGGIRWVTFAPDGEHLYYGTPRGDAFRVAVIGGLPVALASGIRGTLMPSPDGRSVSFTRWRPESGERVVMIAHTDGGNERRLFTRRAPGTLVADSLAWAPDSRAIAVVTDGPAGSPSMSLVEVNVETGRERVITDALPWNSTSLAWLPDGAGLLVGAGRIWHVAREGGAIEPVTTDAAFYRGLSIAKDGGSIGAIQSATTSTVWSAAWPSLDAPQRMLSEAGINNGIAWLPGNRIVYPSYATGDPELWITTPEKGGPRQLTSAAGRDIYPAAPSDGRFIAFASARDGGSAIWKMDPDGGGLTRLSPAGPQYGTTVSPDGRLVAYHRADEAQSWSIWTIPSSGGEPTRLTNAPATFPAFSPDGRFVACNYLDKGRWQIGVIAVQGGATPRIFDSPGEATRRLGWTPDGKEILLAVGKNVDGVAIESGSHRTVLSDPAQNVLGFTFSPDGRRFAWITAAQSTDAVVLQWTR